MKELRRFLYQLARRFRDFEVLLSFNPTKILKRVVNKQIGKRLLRRLFLP